MIKQVENPVQGESLKKLLHDKIDRLDSVQLSLLNRVLLQLEAEGLAADLDIAFDEDRNSGKLTEQRVQQVVSAVRGRHSASK